MRRGSALTVTLLAVLLAACGSEPPRAPPDKRGTVTTVELSAFEVRDDNIDRFEHCPPAGEIGQEWLPPIPEWHPSTSAAVPESAVEDAGAPAPEPAPAPDAPAAVTPGDVSSAPASVTTLTGEAIKATRAGFRSCYHRGLLYDPTQDGHVGIVLRVDRTGRVAAVETYGACDLPADAVRCMRDEGMHVRLPPPAAGAATVTVPAVFTSGQPRIKGANDTYAAGAYVAVESMRPRLHQCLQAAHGANEAVVASAVMTVDVDAQGRGVHIAVDQWKGGHELLGCAAQVIREAPYPRPPAGIGKVVVPLVFNPRPGTR
jgi:hypothetical protein